MRDSNEKQEKQGKRGRMDMKDKQAWLGLASACAVVLLAIVMIIAFAGGEQPSIDAGNISSSGGASTDVGNSSNGPQQPVDEDMGMGFPIQTVNVSNEFGFFYNKTLDCYYHHDGMDFIAEAGVDVLAAEDGVVESIYSGDILKGTEIVLDHGNGLKTVYRFVTVVEDLAVGDEVKQGDKIAVVSEAMGDEYKDGAHLHFEISENGKSVDPTAHLVLAEK